MYDEGIPVRDEGDRGRRGWLALLVPGAALLAVAGLLLVRDGRYASDATALAPGVAFLAAAVLAVCRILGPTVTRSEGCRLAGWIAAGATLAGVAAASYAIAGPVDPRGRQFAHGLVVALAAGMLSGSVVAAYDLRARRRERAADERRRETVALMNRLLRHHVLNGLNVVEGNARLLEAHVDEDGRSNLRAIRSRSTRLTETVERFRELTDRLADPPSPEPIALGPLLETELERIRSTHDGATFALADDPPDAEVLADETLSIAVSNVLANAVESADGPNPCVDVSVDAGPNRTVLTVADADSGVSVDADSGVSVDADSGVSVDADDSSVSVADGRAGVSVADGPGVPDGSEATVLDPSVREGTGVGDDLALSLTAAIVEGYGGEIRVERLPAGAAFEVSLRSA